MIILINNKIKRVEDSNLFKVPFLRTPFLRSGGARSLALNITSCFESRVNDIKKITLL